MSLAIARANARNRMFRERYDKALGRLYHPPHKLRVPTKIAKALMLQESIIVNGKLMEIHTKSLGAGVHEVYLKRAN